MLLKHSENYEPRRAHHRLDIYFYDNGRSWDNLVRICQYPFQCTCSAGFQPSHLIYSWMMKFAKSMHKTHLICPIKQIFSLSSIHWTCLTWQFPCRKAWNIGVLWEKELFWKKSWYWVDKLLRATQVELILIADCMTWVDNIPELNISVLNTQTVFGLAVRRFASSTH